MFLRNGKERTNSLSAKAKFIDMALNAISFLVHWKCNSKYFVVVRIVIKFVVALLFFLFNKMHGGMQPLQNGAIQSYPSLHLNPFKPSAPF